MHRPLKLATRSGQSHSRLLFYCFLPAVLTCVILTGLVSADATEETITLADLPQSIHAALSDVQVEEVERVTDEDRVFFEIEIEVGDAEIELTLDPNGTLLGIEVEEDDDEDEEEGERDEDD